ncbi:mechanosensitive ion channel family protein [Agromyces sp. SYSU T0242]|uniref:mechanosensitive ion channel family protein n=1 Tax=Agromyces litoreus TaxID=3158561 RepID=UPI0033921901
MADLIDWTGGIDPWDVVFALLSVIAAWIASRFARRAVRALLGRLTGIPPGMGDAIVGASGAFVILLGIGVALAFLGAPLQPLIALVLIVGAIVVLVLRGIADNFSAGIVIQTRHPVMPGDHVASHDTEGTVEALTSRAVIVRTYDGRAVHIPNSEFLNSPFANVSAFGASRSELEVRMPLAEDDPTRALDELAAAAGRAEGVRTAPPERAPSAFAVTVGEGRLTARLLVWHDPGASRAACSAVVREVAGIRGDGGLLVTSVLPDTVVRTDRR